MTTWLSGRQKSEKKGWQLTFSSRILTFSSVNNHNKFDPIFRLAISWWKLHININCLIINSSVKCQQRLCDISQRENCPPINSCNRSAAHFAMRNGMGCMMKSLCYSLKFSSRITKIIPSMNHCYELSTQRHPSIRRCDEKPATDFKRNAIYL